MTCLAFLTKTDGHYLNLPVMNEGGEIVGMVDVLRLTYATLEQVGYTFIQPGEVPNRPSQINTISTADNEGPAWNKFWLSTDNDTDSMVSGGGMSANAHGQRSLLSPEQRSHIDRENSVMPNESASHHGEEIPSGLFEHQSAPAELISFPFKFKAPNGRVHRLQYHPGMTIAEFVPHVASKVGSDLTPIGGEAVIEGGELVSGFALSYLDNEGDTVSITSSQDLAEAVSLARSNRKDKVDLFVHHPEKPPVVEPAHPPASKENDMKSAIDDDGRSSVSHYSSLKEKLVPSHHTEEQFIPGVPNELILPGAMFTLAGVIVGVFVLSRIGSR